MLSTGAFDQQPRRQHALQRARSILVVSFVVWHLGVMLATGAPQPLRSVLWPLIEWYAEGLRMTNTFGMFSRPPKKVVLVVVGIRSDGTKVDLATSASTDRDPWARVVDARLRKVQDKLLDPGARRRWGDAYLQWFCRSGDEHGVMRVRLEARDGSSLRTLLRKSCVPHATAPIRNAGAGRRTQ